MLDELIDKFTEQLNGFYKNENRNQSEYIKVGFDVLDYIISQINVKDTFDFKYSPSIAISNYAISKKMNVSFDLSYNFIYHTVNFSCFVHNWENIKNLNDEFWVDFIEVCNKYNFFFNQLSAPKYDKELAPELNLKFKSNIFNLMNTYINSMLTSATSRKNLTFGTLEASWATKTPVSQIIDELIIAFKWFYKFNYLLYKADATRKVNKVNRNKK